MTQKPEDDDDEGFFDESDLLDDNSDWLNSPRFAQAQERLKLVNSFLQDQTQVNLQPSSELLQRLQPPRMAHEINRPEEDPPTKLPGE